MDNNNFNNIQNDNTTPNMMSNPNNLNSNTELPNNMNMPGQQQSYNNNTPIQEAPISQQPYNNNAPIQETPISQQPFNNNAPIQETPIQQQLNNNVPVQQVPTLPYNNTSVEPQYMQGQNISPMIGQQTKKNNNMGVFIVLILVLGGVGYYLFSKSGKSTSSGCIDDFKKDMAMSSNGIVAMSSGDTQYVFDSSYDTDFLFALSKFENLRIKICYNDANTSSINFQIGDTNKTQMVSSLELYDENGKQIKANNINELLKELGYHAYGKYTEKVKVIDFSKNYDYAYINGKSAKIYDVTIELSNGKKVDAEYTVIKDQTDKINELEKGKEYTVDFEVKEDTFEPMVYTITDIK